jgi:hypothetical protein
MKQTNTHGGKRKGAGRKPVSFPVFLKKLRATEEERAEFMSLLSGNARYDFELLFAALKYRRKALKKWSA